MVVFVLRVKSTRQSLPRVNGSVREMCPLAFEVGCCGIDLCDAGNYSVQFIPSTEGVVSWERDEGDSCFFFGDCDRWNWLWIKEL